jgi:hypothetical protein
MPGPLLLLIPFLMGGAAVAASSEPKKRTPRFGGIHPEVLKNLLAQPRVMDALIAYLEVPGKPAHLKKLPEEEKGAAIKRQVEHLIVEPTSRWFKSEPSEVLAAACFALDLPAKIIGAAFSQAKKEADLTPAVGALLRRSGYIPHAEVPLGTKCIDVVGRKGDRVVGVEIKNELSQLTRALDQMTTFGDYLHSVSLACTPALIAEYLHKHARARTVGRWEADVLYRRLKEVHFGLVIVEGDKAEFEIDPHERTPEPSRLKEALTATAAAKEVPATFAAA